MADYDDIASEYDATRGGVARAVEAAHAIDRLLPTRSTVLDLATGTGIVARELADLGHRTVGLDMSAGMLALASPRLPGALVRADAAALPFADGTLEAIAAIWLLHLLDDARPVLGEVARALGSGGCFVTTADKRAASRLSLGRVPGEGTAQDAAALLVRECAAAGLELAGATSFVGTGQTGPGRDPVYPVLAFRRA
ncbi:class I SAM-dependent methyltransferase [Tsukamurella sp. 1534]|uniref:class I SAM-dependent methyltransferase n=1 Tax=Tsukamurella sp. 1534 TaxID=1151061 RepID=UPI0002D2EF09|nr:class I SAM-dependent methyltransferase [Tsukamurella sp. 1534]